MPIIPDRSNFAPDDNALVKWLGTRKMGKPIGNTTLPGFYSDSGFSDDSRWFWFGIVGEIVGIGLIFAGASKKGGVFALVAILLALAFVACDLFLANKLHQFVAKRTWIKNRLFILGNSNPQQSQGLRTKQDEGKAQDTIFKIFIILIGLIKFVAVVALGVTRNPIVYIPIAVLYAFVCYVHISHTGYYLAHEYTEKMFKQQNKAYGINGYGASRILRHLFTLQSRIQLPIKMGNIAQIIPNTDYQGVNGGNHYVLETEGVLIDDDISMLVTGQETSVRDSIALECRKHQMSMCPALA